jgi:hypothetical protein
MTFNDLPAGQWFMLNGAPAVKLADPMKLGGFTYINAITIDGRARSVAKMVDVQPTSTPRQP